MPSVQTPKQTLEDNAEKNLPDASFPAGEVSGKQTSKLHSYQQWWLKRNGQRCQCSGRGRPSPARAVEQSLSGEVQAEISRGRKNAPWHPPVKAALGAGVATKRWVPVGLGVPMHCAQDGACPRVHLWGWQLPSAHLQCSGFPQVRPRGCQFLSLRGTGGAPLSIHTAAGPWCVTHHERERKGMRRA